jgi:hypothetical protein
MGKNLLFVFVFCAFANCVYAQKEYIAKMTDSIENEGKTLYLSEMASWYGTDIFLAKCKSKVPRIGGYLSYDTGSGMNNIFFSKDAQPVVLATMSFPYAPRPDNCQLDSTERKLTATEAGLYKIRSIAMGELRANKDTIFRFYKNTGTNPVPIIINGQKRVSFLTSPHENGIIIFGNDYLTTFDTNDQIIGTKRLHKNLISIPTVKSPGDTSRSVSVAGVHTHVAETGEFITATDICTLMLYERFTTWKQYFVVSPTYISIWDCTKNSLTAITKEAWDKIMGDRKVKTGNN